VGGIDTARGNAGHLTLPRIAISGHRGLPSDTARRIDEVIREALSGRADDVTGLSCLADGADQIFARAVLDLGGSLEAVVPAGKYRAGLPPEARPEFDRLLALAARVHRLHFTESTSEAYMAAGEFMLRRADELWAVWDGEPARGYGGTADVVALGAAWGLPVRVIWPEGAHRD
jgi:hypothetical protein